MSWQCSELNLLKLKLLLFWATFDSSSPTMGMKSGHGNSPLSEDLILWWLRFSLLNCLPNVEFNTIPCYKCLLNKHINNTLCILNICLLLITQFQYSQPVHWDILSLHSRENPTKIISVIEKFSRKCKTKQSSSFHYTLPVLIMMFRSDRDHWIQCEMLSVFVFISICNVML